MIDFVTRILIALPRTHLIINILAIITDLTVRVLVHAVHPRWDGFSHR